MAFPYVFESNFEGGNLTDEWDGSPTDTESRLSAVHYTEMARRIPKAAPFRGAYAMMVETTASGTANAFVTQDAIAIADTETRYFRLGLFFAENFTATADDSIAILELRGAADAVTVVFGARVIAATNEIQLGVGGAAAAASLTAFTHGIRRGVWYQVHMAVTIQTGGTGTVAITVTADDERVQGATAASVSTITNIAVTYGILGCTGRLVTTTGIYLIDHFAMDDEALPWLERFPEQLILTKSAHVCLGDGCISGLTLLTGSAADNVVRVYDTDRGQLSRQVAEVDSLAASETVELAQEIKFARGCYVTLGGTAPRARLHVRRARGYSAAGIRDLGLRV